MGGGGGYDKHPLKGNSSGVEGAQAQVPSVGAQGRGGMYIFWNYKFLDRFSFSEFKNSRVG